MGSRTQSNRKEGQTGQVGCAGRINLAFIAGKGFSSLVLLVVAVECRRLRVLVGVLGGWKANALAIAGVARGVGVKFGLQTILSLFQPSVVEGTHDSRMNSRIGSRTFRRIRPIPLPRDDVAAIPFSVEPFQPFGILLLVERLAVA